MPESAVDPHYFNFDLDRGIRVQVRPEWNESGFGSKVPGKGRPGTERVSRWDERYPKR